MTRRKPPRVTIPDWVDQQIRTAEARGAFDNLPGAGKPIPDLDQPRPELAWVANYLRRENVDVGGVLPPALALAREVEKLPERLLTERTEDSARAVVIELNERIIHAHAAPQDGPLVRVKLVDVDAAVAQWAESRAEYLRLRAEALDRAAATLAASEGAPRPIRWWQRTT